MSFLNMNLLDTLKLIEDPCHTIHFFSPTLRKLVPRKNDDEIESRGIYDRSTPEPDNYYQLTLMQNNAIENFRNEPCDDGKLLAKDVSKRCIVLIVSNIFKEDRKSLLQSLEKESQWKVVISCQNNFCPIIKGIPATQMILLNPINLKQKLHTLREVIRNPTFDRLKFAKYSKLDHVNLSCMFNTTVYVYGMKLTTELLEKAVLITSNTRDLTSKIVFKTHIGNVYFVIGRLENTNVSIISDEEPSDETDKSKTNEVIIADDFPPIDFLCSHGTNKSVLLFLTINYPKEKYLEIKKKCKKRFKGLSINVKEVVPDHHFGISFDRENHFIDDVTNTACFEKGKNDLKDFFSDYGPDDPLWIMGK